MSKASGVKITKKGEKKGLNKSKAKLNMLSLYRQRPKRDRKGRIIYQEFQSSDTSHQARIEPNRKWFGPTRTVSQKELTNFREEMKKQQQNPNSVILKARKVPYSLLRDPKKEGSAHILEVESYNSTFGKKSTRKRPRLNTYTLQDYASQVTDKTENYDEEKDRNIKREEELFRMDLNRAALFKKGQSSRIWNELYKVIDSSDVIIQVLDARDPMGTRCKRVEEHVKKNCPHKHIIMLINKCDLIPTWALRKWVKLFSKEYPTIAFHAHLTKSFGKGSLIQLLRQFQHLHSDKPQISVGFIGYPNVGKSSIINTLRSKKVCNVAPVPGETKVWQYVTLFKKIFLVDCPGVVTPAIDEPEEEIVLKGVIRIENLDDPTSYITPLIHRANKQYMEETYGIFDWNTADEFLEKLAFKMGKLHKKGEPDFNTVAKLVLHDWVRGKIPYYVSPPEEKESDNKEKNKAEQKKEENVIVPKQKLSNVIVRNEFKEEKDEEADEDEEVEDEEPVEYESDKDMEVVKNELTWEDLVNSANKD